MRRIKPEVTYLTILVLLLAGLIPGTGTARALATTVSINPSAPSVSNCGIVDVYIDVNDVTNLYALDVRLTFDPAVIEVVDFSPGGGVDIEPIIDPVLQFNAGFTIRNVANNFTGTIWYAATQTNPTPARNGSGHVARLRLRAKSTGSSALTFTYIKLSDPNGIEIPATAANGTVTASTTVRPTLSISRLNTTQVQLSWPVAAGVSQYHLYRSATPYFYAADPAYQVLTPPSPPGPQTFNDSVLGNVTTNYFYTLRAECSAGGKSAAANQVGKFEYLLRETADTDYSWVALPLGAAGISNSIDLANHIQSNSSAAVNVLTVSQWNGLGQSIEIYDHVYEFGDFPVVIKMPYRVEIDIPGSGSGSVIWALVGSLPSITTDTYRLYETADTDYTWVMQPLDLTTYTSAYDLAVHIQNNVSAPAAVLTLSQWNNSGQSIEIYDHQYSYGDFTTRFGYPYRVEINVNTGTSVTWP